MPKRPWNQVSLPVYSLATTDNKGKVNFNMCTYVSAISLTPKLFAIAVYEKTQTLSNLLENPQRCNLITLGKDCIDIFRILGRLSGSKVDKQKLIEKKGFTVDKFKDSPSLSQAVNIMNMSIQSYQKYGDHTLFIMKVESYKTLNEKQVLYTKDLIDKKLIL